MKPNIRNLWGKNNIRKINKIPDRCSLKLQRPYRTFGPSETESLPDQSNFQWSGHMGAVWSYGSSLVIWELSGHMGAVWSYGSGLVICERSGHMGAVWSYGSSLIIWERSGQDLNCLQFHLHYLDKVLYSERPFWVNFRVITTNNLSENLGLFRILLFL